LLIYAGAQLLPGTLGWTERLARWGTVFAMFLIPTLVTVGAARLSARRRVVPTQVATD